MFLIDNFLNRRWEYANNAIAKQRKASSVISKKILVLLACLFVIMIGLGITVPVLPFYVKEHAVGWLRPSFADLLRRWPHVFEVSPAFVTLKARPDTAVGRSEAGTCSSL